jgi:hypothetical protein
MFALGLEGKIGRRTDRVIGSASSSSTYRRTGFCCRQLILAPEGGEVHGSIRSRPDVDVLRQPRRYQCTCPRVVTLTPTGRRPRTRGRQLKVPVRRRSRGATRGDLNGAAYPKSLERFGPRGTAWCAAGPGAKLTTHFVTGHIVARRPRPCARRDRCRTHQVSVTQSGGHTKTTRATGGARSRFELIEGDEDVLTRGQPAPSVRPGLSRPRQRQKLARAIARAEAAAAPEPEQASADRIPLTTSASRWMYSLVCDVELRRGGGRGCSWPGFHGVGGFAACGVSSVTLRDPARPEHLDAELKWFAGVNGGGSLIARCVRLRRDDAVKWLPEEPVIRPGDWADRRGCGAPSVRCGPRSSWRRTMNGTRISR